MAKKAIKGFEHYSIDEYGVVYNDRKGTIRKSVKNYKGYHQVMLVDGPLKRSNPMIHRLVFSHFVCAIPEGLEINHIDGNKDNNHLSNLELVTRRENINKAVELGLFKSGKSHKASKQLVCFTPQGEKLVFESIGLACKYLKVKHDRIWKCLTGKSRTVKGHSFILQEDINNVNASNNG